MNMPKVISEEGVDHDAGLILGSLPHSKVYVFVKVDEDEAGMQVNARFVELGNPPIFAHPPAFPKAGVYKVTLYLERVPDNEVVMDKVLAQGIFKEGPL